MGFEKLNAFIDLIENINRDTSFDGILKYIYQSFSAFIPYSHIGIALLKDNGETLEASYSISDPAIRQKTKGLIGIKAALSSTSLSYIIKNGTARVINDLPSRIQNSSAAYNRVILKAGIKASVTLPLKISSNPIGIIFFSSTEKNIYKDEHIKFLEAISNSIAISLNKNILIDELLYSSILALAKMSEARDEDTGDHLERMKRYSGLIAEFLLRDEKYPETINSSFIKNIERFSPMHDIGKVGIKDGILLKHGSLTPDEFEEMKKHTHYGAEIMLTAEKNIAKRNESMFRLGVEIALGHHEKWDGTGYPYGKSGNEIPLSARIVALADVFDALTSKRSYKEAYDFETSFTMIVQEKGTHFDPQIIDSFEKHKNELYDLYKSFSQCLAVK